MKKLSLFLAATLFLSSCQTPSAPVNGVSAPNPTSSREEPASQASSSETKKEQKAQKADSEETLSSAAANIPMPEEMPAAADSAVSLPEKLASQSQGWSVTLLTPAQYTLEAPVNRGGPSGFMDCDVFRAVQGNRVTLFNANGKQISQDGEFEHQGESWYAVEGAVTATKNGLSGLVDAATGETLVPAEYAYVYPIPGRPYYRAEKEHSQGDILRKETLEIAYSLGTGDEYSPLGEERDLLYQNGTLKLFELDGTPVKNLVCDSVSIVARDTDEIGVNRLAVQENGKWALYDGDGELVTNPVYDSFGPSFQGDYISFRRSGKWGIMDYTGKVTIKPRWDDIILSEYGAVLYEGNKCTATTELDREPDGAVMYDEIGHYSENGYVWFKKDGKYGLLDDAGNVVMTPRQQGPIYGGMPGLEDGVFLVEGNNGPNSFGIIANGKMVLPLESLIFLQGINPYYDKRETYNLICTPSGKWGYIDGEGQFLIDTRFEAADGFIKDRDVAMVKYNGKICLNDRKGNVVLETVFDSCSAFNPDTMVAAMGYTSPDGQSASCLVRLVPS